MLYICWHDISKESPYIFTFSDVYSVSAYLRYSVS